MTRPALLLILLESALAGQMAQTPPGQQPREASTPEEFDAYLEFHLADNQASRHLLAQRFEHDYPDSQLLIYIYESELAYARDRGLHRDAVATGEKALRLAPTDVKVLLDMAEIVADSSQNGLPKSRAEEFALQALEQTDLLRFPRQVTLDQCEEIRRALRSRTHAVLGQLAAGQNRLDAAILDFETAIAENPVRDGSQLYRLGKLYQASSRREDAVRAFRQAAQAGPAAVVKLAEAELRSAEGGASPARQ